MKKKGMDRERSFPRSYASLPEVFVFVEEFFSDGGVTHEHLKTVNLAVEELFTNLVKYNTGTDHEIVIGLRRDENEVAVTLTDFDVDRFDITQLPEVDVDLPLVKRRPGGLGIHLVKKLMDRVEYEYEGRNSRTTIIKRLE